MLQAENGVSVLETCTTASPSLQVNMFAPRGYNECECDWIAIRVTRLRLLYEASQISESGYRRYGLACDCCWSPQRSRRSHGAFRMFVVSPDYPESAKSTHQQLKCIGCGLIRSVCIAPTRWRLCETSAAWTHSHLLELRQS